MPLSNNETIYLLSYVMNYGCRTNDNARHKSSLFYILFRIFSLITLEWEAGPVDPWSDTLVLPSASEIWETAQNISGAEIEIHQLNIPILMFGILDSDLRSRVSVFAGRHLTHSDNPVRNLGAKCIPQTWLMLNSRRLSGCAFPG